MYVIIRPILAGWVVTLLVDLYMAGVHPVAGVFTWLAVFLVTMFLDHKEKQHSRPKRRRRLLTSLE